MSSLEWFYMQQWKKKQYEHLVQHRLILVRWATDTENKDLPISVKLPPEVELTDSAINNYLSETYGYLVSSWRVATEQE